MTMLREFTKDGEKPVGIKRRCYNKNCRHYGVVGITFIYPLTGGCMLAIKDNAGVWRDVQWYADYVSFLDDWRAE